MCNPAFAAVPVAAYAANTIINPKGGDGPTKDKQSQMDKYSSMTDPEDLTKYELKMARFTPGSHGSGHRGNLDRSMRDPHTREINYGVRHNIPLPHHLAKIRKKRIESGEDTRQLGYGSVNPLHMSRWG